MHRAKMVLALVVAAGSVRAAALDGQLLNADFERVDAEGHAAEWTYDNGFYRLAVAGGRNGTNGMMFDSGGRDSGSPLLQRVRARPGLRYRFGCWIRTEALKGNGYCARVCLLWEDQFGRFIEGAYRTPHINGTHDDWVKCEGVSEKTPADAAWVTVRPEVVGPATGKAWFDDVFLEPYDTNPVVGLYTSAYRGEQATGSVTFGASLCLAGVGVKPSDCRAVFVWKGPDGTDKTREATEFQLSCAKLTVPISEISVGRSEIRFQLLRRSDGKELSQRKCPFERTLMERRRRVTFDRLGRTIVDGRPFFPLGMYWSISKPYHKFQLPPINASNIVEYAKGPFNCTMPYLEPTREQMDVCASNGIKVIYALMNDFTRRDWDPSGKDPKRRHAPNAVRHIKAFRDHPALLAWYLNDERDIRELENLTGRYRTVCELDPDHPAWIALYQFDQIADYLPTFDAFGTDPYPVPRLPIGEVIKFSRVGYEGAMKMRPMWQVPQAFDWATFKSGRAGDRMPTREEMRNMSWQNIAGGANGLIYYSYTYLASSPTTTFEVAWADVCAVAQEVKDNFDVLLSDGTPPSFTVSNPAVAARTWKRGKRNFVLVVNTTREPASAVVSLGRDDCRIAKERFRDGTVRFSAGSLALELPGLGCALLELEAEIR